MTRVMRLVAVIGISLIGGSATTMQQCVDESTGQFVRAMGAKEPCAKNAWHRDGHRLLTKTVCT